MREWCGCGAGIKGKPSVVKQWRKTHRHPADSAPEQGQGHPPTSGGSQVEHAWQGIGFRPEDA